MGNATRNCTQSRNKGCRSIPLGITPQHTSEAFAPTFNSTGIVKLLLPPGGAWGSVISVAHHPYSCAARAEARPRRVGARTARLWKDCRGSLQPRLHMR